jgi:hypothetical protein
LIFIEFFPYDSTPSRSDARADPGSPCHARHSCTGLRGSTHSRIFPSF